MDSDRRSAQVERLEVVDTGRRRRWPEDEKLKIVLESLQAPRQVAATARRYGVSRSLLLRWRRSFQPYRRWWSRNQGRRPVQSRRRAAAGGSRSSLLPGLGCGSWVRSTRRR
ncbi:transposase [Bradyrhizobium sp. Leo121]|uniref:transposase n=1 Tax=Bradyrhizobium sp. Leo121 TaxID=1571195 RepID=UPI001FDFA96C|nr:transposase [Bradyrhizobium sp. Leo121]